MHLRPVHIIFSLYLISQQALALFEPHAVDLPTRDNADAPLPEHHNYGLFDRPFPVQIDETDEHEKPNIKRQTDTSVSADPVPTTAGDVGTITSAPITPLATATATGDYGGTDLGDVLSDTYMLPPAYDSAQLSSLFAADSSAYSEASAVLSAIDTGKGVVCSGVPDVSGSEVTVCGPTGNPSATGKKGNGADERAWGNVSWGFMALGILGGGIAFFL